MVGNIANPADDDRAGECINSPVSKCNQYSHQVRLLPITNKVSVTEIPYVFIINKQLKKSDITDREGKTSRIYTSGTEKLDVLVGKLASSYVKRKNSFGSLKNIEERKIKLITEIDYPLHQHPYTSGYDYITVSAARTDAEFWGRSKGNEYRFVNCSLLQLSNFPESSKHDHAIQRIHVVFQQGYTENDIKNINTYTENLGARIIYVKNTNEFIVFLNQRKEKKRLIKQLVIFCHGIFNHASFHYKGKKVDEGLFGLTDIPKVEEPIFDYDALITTYACRAGISVDSGNLTDKDAGQDNSQAQKMADSWDVKVEAFEMRSSYARVYGTGTEIKEARAYAITISNYQQALAIYQQQKAAGNKGAKPPEKPDNYDEMVKRHNDLNTREKNEKDGDGPIAPNGAWDFPGTGDTPKGLNPGLQDYKPKEWKI